MIDYIVISNVGFTLGEKSSEDVKILGLTSKEILLLFYPEAQVISLDEYQAKKGEVARFHFTAMLFGENEVGFQSPEDYPKVVAAASEWIMAKHIANGAIIDMPRATSIDFTVKIGGNVRIMPFNTLCGDTEIGDNTVLYPYNDINNGKIGKNCTVTSSTIRNGAIGNNVTLGPNAYLRPNANVGDNCRIGDFVEIKNANIGGGTKISHLTYVGDADLGERINVGCGVIFANYDGKHKHRTTVGDDCFIGSNSNLVAPINIASGAFIAAGTTVTKDVSSGDFVIGRCRQENKPGLANKYLK